MHYTFVKHFLLFSFLGIFLVISFNYVVDPFNVHQATFEGFNHAKPESSGRLTAALNTARFKPKTIVLGTSRVIHITSDSLDNNEKKSFYNAGFPGASFDEIYDYFLHAISVQRDLKRVILGIDLFSFHANRKPQADFKKERLQIYSSPPQDLILDHVKAPGLSDRKSVHISNIDRLAITQPRELSQGLKSNLEAGWSINSFSFDDLKEILLTYKALRDSFNVIYYRLFNVKSKNPIIEMGDEKYLQEMLKSEENYKDYALDPVKIKKFQSLIEICKERSIDLNVFICPVKALYWEFYYQNDLWLPLENLKRQLCAFHPLWDFSGYNPITLETLESEGEALYHECSHFTVHTGNLLLKRMLGQPSSIDSIGFLLSPENVDQTLAEILEQRSQWLLNENINLVNK